MRAAALDDRRAFAALRAAPAACSVEAWGRLAILLLLVVLLLGALGRVVTKPLWHDELVTLYVADAPTRRALWNALESGTDLNPPLYHVAVRAARAVVGPESIAVRLPSTLGFTVMVVCLFAFVSRREGIGPGVVALLTPALTGAWVYACEGRPYGFVLAGSALALLGWQFSTERRRPWPLLLCAGGVAVAVSSHYYSVLLLLPLAAAEATRSALRRRIDWPIWLALVTGLLPLAAFVPLVATARTFAPTYFAKPTVWAWVDSWRHLLAPLSVPLAAAAGVWLVLLASKAPGSRRIESAPSRMPAPELVATAGFLLVPSAGWVLGRLGTGVFLDRYVISAVIGVAIALALVAARAGDRRTRMVVAAVFVTAFGIKQAIAARPLFDGADDPLRAHAALQRADVPARLPIVVSDALVFLPLAHYAGTGLSDRLVYLMKPEPVVQRLRIDTGSRALAGLRQVRSLDVREYGGFIEDHPRFLVYGPANWLSAQLAADGFSLMMRGQDGNGLLLEAARESHRNADPADERRSSVRARRACRS